MFRAQDTSEDDGGGNARVPTAPIRWSIQLMQTLLQQTIEQTVIRKTGKRNGVGLLLYNTKTKRGDHPKKCGQDINKETDDDGDDDDKMDDDDDDDRMDDDEDDDEDDEEEEDGNQEENSPALQSETTVHRLLDLKPPGVRHVRTIRKLLVEDNNRQHKNTTERNLETEFCPSEDDPDPNIAPLQTALEESTRMFLDASCVRDPTKNARGKNEYDTKSIWIFTNQASPYSDEKKELIQNISNEIKEQRIEIMVWPLTVPSNNNQYRKKDDTVFVSPFFESVASDGVSEQRLCSFYDLEDRLDEIHQTLAKKRRTYYSPMHIFRPGKGAGHNRSAKDPAIMIDWYSLVQLLKRPGKVQIDTQTKR